jgi:hypothetical protein
MKNKILSCFVCTLLSTSVLTIFVTENVSADCLDGMIAYWKFDEGSGTVAYDSVDANNGIIHGASWTLDTPSGEGYALDFDGYDDYVNVGQFTQFGGTQPFTLCAWIKKTTYQTGEPNILNNMCSSRGGIALFSNGNRQAVMVGGIDGTVYQAPVFEFKDIMDDEWHFIVGTYDGNNLCLYDDGHLVDCRNDFSYYTSSSYNMNIGRMEQGNRLYFDGMIDEVRIYNIALSQTEIQDCYNELITINIDFDIKPGSYPNSINPISYGNVPVTVLTTDDFDASKVNPDTVVFLDATPCKKEKLEDVDDDGDIDMLFYFKIQELDFELLVDDGDEYPYAYLTGVTIDGQSIEGKDTVKLVPPNQRLLETIFERLFERFPNLFPILQKILLFYLIK